MRIHIELSIYKELSALMIPFCIRKPPDSLGVKKSFSDELKIKTPSNIIELRLQEARKILEGGHL